MNLKRLLCALALGGNILIADPVSIPVLNYVTIDKLSEIEIRKKDFSFQVYDYNLDKKADSAIIINKGEKFSFLRPNFNSENSIKELQVFDIADKFLKSYNDANSDNYLTLIQDRFPVKKIEINEKTNLGKFFAEDFAPKKNLEDLIAYSYTRYSKIIKEIKKTKPNQTFQNLMENCTFFDAVRFVFLFSEYNKNLETFGYKLEKLPSFENDYFEIGFVNLKNGPSFRAEMNMNFDSDTIDAKEIGNFIASQEKSFFRYDEKGNYFYGIFRYSE